MGAAQNPRQAVAELLRGKAPARPLFLPIVFSLGARIENVPLRTYLENPTKITSALRQVREHLPADGVTCYFDPLLEAEALGAKVHWQTGEGPAEVHWPGGAGTSHSHRGMRSAEEAAKSGRVPVAAEVIRRMKDALRGTAMVMAGLSGPLALAHLILQSKEGRAGRDGEEQAETVRASGAAVGEIARTMLEAGADVVLIQERIPAGLAGECVEEGVSQLRTAANIIQFYEALPVLLLSAGDARGPLTAFGGAASACIVCRDWSEARGAQPATGAEGPICGVSLAANAFDGVESRDQDLRLAETIRAVRPALVTTAGDISRIANLKRLAQLRDELKR